MNPANPKYKIVALGGTFAPLHKGHRSLLERAFDVGEYVIIGLTSDEMVQYKEPPVPPFEKRKKALEDYLINEGYQNYSIIKIEDISGGINERRDVNALIVSEETLERAEMINNFRQQNGISPLFIEVIPLVKDKYGNKLSSANIRRGIYNTEGE